MMLVGRSQSIRDASSRLLSSPFHWIYLRASRWKQYLPEFYIASSCLGNTICCRRSACTFCLSRRDRHSQQQGSHITVLVPNLNKEPSKLSPRLHCLHTPYCYLFRTVANAQLQSRTPLDSAFESLDPAHCLRLRHHRPSKLFDHILPFRTSTLIASDQLKPTEESIPSTLSETST
jgi:hypothetical protein